ncbi:MAG TPA: glycosyltransferase [Casimicrobiaceae bacterium]|nr:glycosyltransferase [Casimicrobiaceae bacterium]
MTRTQPSVSAVICSIDDAKFARVTANYRLLYGGRELEIVGIHDARSLAEGYNRGIARSHGELVILSHDDIEILTPDFAARLDRHLKEFDLIGIAGTTRLVNGKWEAAGDPYAFALISRPDADSGEYVTVLQGGGPLVVPGIQALDGVFMAMRRRVATSVPFDEALFDHFHLYDLDFSFRAYRAGFAVAVCRDIVIIHQSAGKFDSVWEEYRRRFVAKHRAHLPDRWDPKEGARAGFYAATPDAIRERCDPAHLAEIVERIAQANAAL